MRTTTPPDTTGMWHASSTIAAQDRERWLAALGSFETSQRAKGAQPATIARRVKHVRRFAVAAAISPWHVTTEDVQGWLEGLEVASSTRTAMRDSVRAFYRWAHATQRMASDPTAADSGRALRLPVPSAWEQPLTAYERFLMARGLSPQSVRSTMDQLRTFARDNHWLEPYAVTLDDLYEWMAAKQWARETRRARKVMLRGFFSWAVETGRMESDPTVRLPKVRAGDPLARPATDDDLATALRRADDRWTLALRCSAELGLRREEVARMHSADMVLRDDGHWWLNVHGKGGKTRTLPVPEGLARAIRVRPAGYVFPGRIVERQRHSGEGHMSARYMGKRIAELLPSGVTMHALRHRFATRLYNHNRDVFTLQKLLGHASASTTQRYVQVSDARMRELVEAVL